MGPFDQAIAWSEEAIVGPRRFLERVWKALPQTKENLVASSASLNKLIKKVSEDIEGMKFNTAISSMMIFLNENEKMSRETYEVFLKLLAPFAPHMTDELWQMLGNKNSINQASWPKYDLAKINEDEIKIIIQVNGKVRGEITVSSAAGEAEVKWRAKKGHIC
jgi:leucyl-tRNA synthetase